jgi:NAD+ synthase (glutamine-hydrolysing)
MLTTKETKGFSFHMRKPSAKFNDIYDQGFVRVATCVPTCVIGDPAANATEIVRMVKEGDAQGVGLMVFTELSLTGYSIDDLFMQEVLLDAAELAIEKIRWETSNNSAVILVGAPLRHEGRLYNCAVAIHQGQILGVVPKTHLPNYREFYEKRWFASGRTIIGQEINVAGRVAPFGVDLLFQASTFEDFIFFIEICEDLWAPAPPSDFGALAGATILANLSASNVTVGKARHRKLLCSAQSSRAFSAYLYSAAGPGESTTDLSWDGQAIIYELGNLLAETERFPSGSQMCIADVDVERLRLERQRTGTFNDAATLNLGDRKFRRIKFDFVPGRTSDLRRVVERYPFVPADPARLNEDCYEAVNIQVEALMTRLKKSGISKIAIGVSGGLDSTHALIVAAAAFDRLGLPRKNILGWTMPGFATGGETKGNAWALMDNLGITAAEADIKPMAMEVFRMLGHPFAKGEPVYDVTFENVQAGVRTDFLFRAANMHGALVLGTGDLSELALGWCTYGVGDHMSHYNVNASVPKTLIQHLIRWVISARTFTDETNGVLQNILDTEISPELVPADKDGKMQSTQDKIGPYDLHDFFVYYVTRFGMRPSKIAFLAMNAWNDVEKGEWPANFPVAKRAEYDLATIRKWLETFLFKFFTTSQFKRSAVPNGPKVTSGGSLSPRGDWRAPSDGTATVWIKELLDNVPEQL